LNFEALALENAEKEIAEGTDLFRSFPIDAEMWTWSYERIAM
jgi:hypothetical protein